MDLYLKLASQLDRAKFGNQGKIRLGIFLLPSHMHEPQYFRDVPDKAYCSYFAALKQNKQNLK